VSVPSKTYSILAAGRCVVAAIDDGTEVVRIIDESRAGLAVPPDDPEAFVAAIRRVLADEQTRRSMGESGRRWVEAHVSPASVARSYLSLVDSLGR
jgi:colanic acid biosynthesis glycosyl transferase WcaI